MTRVSFLPAAVAVVVALFSSTTHAWSTAPPVVSEDATSSRRAFLAGSVGVASAALLSTTSAVQAASSKILVLGGTGLVGSEVVRQLKSMGVEVVATSRNGRDGTVALDVTSPNLNLPQEIEQLAKGCTGVISTIGAIGTEQDQVVNAASGLAAAGAKNAGVQHFSYISVAPEVREFGKGFGFLEQYMKGKTFSEESIPSYFDSYTLVEPTFIYGGDSFAVNPPRVASSYGKLVEGLLSSGPLRALTEVTPEGFIKIALEPPVSAESVASACIAGALGKSTNTVLDTYDKIQSAATQVN